MAKTNIYIDGSQAGVALNELKKEYNKVNGAIKEMKRDSDDYRESVKKLGDLKAAMNKHQADIKAVSQSYEQAGKTMKEMPAIQKQNASGWKSIASNALPMVGVAGLISVGIQGVTAAIGSWYRNNKEMEKSLSSLKSITGASAQDIEFYKETAKEMGRTTTLSAIQAVEAFKLIGSARPDLLKDREALAQVTHEAVILAEAAGMELAPAAQALASSMNQFNLGADQSKRIINTLAAGSVEGAAEIEDLTASIDRFGTVANANNVTIEESVALTELLSEKNLKGAEAGTQLRNVLLAMSTASALDAKAVEELNRFGVNVELVMDKTVPFNERLQEMSKISEDQTALLRVFGKENIVVGQTLLQNVDRFSKLTDAVTGTNTAYVQAAINNDNLDGDLKKLSSAWEGLTLSAFSAQSPMRGIVQIGTEVLNWISDVIGLFTEWDELKFEEVFLDFGKLMFVFSDSLREAIDEQQRMNRLTQEVVEGMKAQADEAATLTMALGANNKALKDKNLTDIEAKKIQDENAVIIDKLNKKYPELTKNYDLQNASGTQLSKLQKEITANLLDQALAAAQTTEAERLLAEQVQLSMAIAEQRATEQNRFGITNFVADIFTDDAADLEEQLAKSQDKLQELPKTMKDVSARIKGLNLNFGKTFATQTQLIEESVRKINGMKVNAQMFKGSWMEEIFNGQIKSEEQILKVLKAQAEEEKKKYTDKEKNDKKEADAQAAAEKAAAKAKEKADAAKQAAQDLKKALDGIIESSSKFKIDFAYEKRLSEFSDEFAKEMFVFENGIKSKYQKEIDSARALANDKTEIGKEAAKELASLETLQAEELEFGKNEIRKKWRTKGEQEMAEFQANQTAQQLAQAESYEKALMDIKVARAYAAAQSVKDGDIKAQQEANEQLNAILIEQLEFEAGLKQKALDKQLKEGEINQAEYDARKIENEKVLAEQISAIHTNTQEEILRLFQDRFSKILNSLGEIVSVAENLFNAFYNNQLNNIQNEKNTAIKAEEERMKQGLQTREEFELKRQAIQDASDKKQNELRAEQARQEKAFTVFKIALSTAEAVAKAVAASPLTFGLPFSAFALATGLAQSALALSEPLPQFIDGGFRNIVGANDGKTYNAKKVSPLKGGLTPNTPSYALFSEAGPEYFVPNNLLKDVRVANMVNAIEAIRTNQQGASGMVQTIGNGAMSDEKLVALLNANLVAITALNQKIPNMGVKIGDKQIDDISTRTNELNSFKA